MGGVQRVGDLGADPDRAFGWQRSLRRQERPQVGPLDVAHRDEQRPVGLARGVDRDDVGVLGRGRGFGLPDEPLAERLVLRQLRGQELQRDLAPGCVCSAR